jgi:hypothetical protein
MAQAGRTVAQRALARQVARCLLKHTDLMRNATRAIGIAEMGHEGNFFHLRQGIQARPGRAVTQRRKTKRFIPN